MKSCIFCSIVKGDSPSWKVLENEHAYAFLNINPTNKFHTLIIPKLHYVNIFDIPDNVLREVISLARSVVKLYEEKWRMKDCQLVLSNGKDGQQHVFHLHFHIVPRHAGDGMDIQWDEQRAMDSVLDQCLIELK